MPPAGGRTFVPAALGQIVHQRQDQLGQRRVAQEVGRKPLPVAQIIECVND